MYLPIIYGLSGLDDSSNDEIDFPIIDRPTGTYFTPAIDCRDFAELLAICTSGDLIGSNMIWQLQESNDGTTFSDFGTDQHHSLPFSKRVFHVNLTNPKRKRHIRIKGTIQVTSNPTAYGAVTLRLSPMNGYRGVPFDTIIVK